MEETVVVALFSLASLVTLVVAGKMLFMLPRHRRGEHAITLRWLRLAALGIVFAAMTALVAGGLALPVGDESGLSRDAIRYLLVADRVLRMLAAVALFMAYARLFGGGGGRP